MSVSKPANVEELLYQEFIASKVVYKITKRLCIQLPDDHPEKAENLKKLQEFKNKLDIINKHYLKHIDDYVDLMDPELSSSLSEDDIILLRKELNEAKKTLMSMRK